VLFLSGTDTLGEHRLKAGRNEGEYQQMKSYCKRCGKIVPVQVWSRRIVCVRCGTVVYVPPAEEEQEK
jgi:ribosomal protein S27AE